VTAPALLLAGGECRWYEAGLGHSGRPVGPGVAVAEAAAAAAQAAASGADIAVNPAPLVLPTAGDSATAAQMLREAGGDDGTSPDPWHLVGCLTAAIWEAALATTHEGRHAALCAAAALAEVVDAAADDLQSGERR
jgi:hypothetical protein